MTDIRIVYLHTATSDGECAVCERPYVVGDLIARTTDDESVCLGCSR